MFQNIFQLNALTLNPVRTFRVQKGNAERMREKIYLLKTGMIKMGRIVMGVDSVGLGLGFTPWSCLLFFVYSLWSRGLVGIYALLSLNFGFWDRSYLPETPMYNLFIIRITGGTT